MKTPSLLKNKSVLFGLGIVICVIVLAIFSTREDLAPPTPSSVPTASQFPISDLHEERRRELEEYRRLIASRLPIYLENFTTSVGLNTTINLYYLPSDEPHVVRLEIYGLSYLNSNPDEAVNPNVTAFKESYLEAFRLMRERGLDPTRLEIVYSDREDIRRTIAVWLDNLDLTP